MEVLRLNTGKEEVSEIFTLKHLLHLVRQNIVIDKFRKRLVELCQTNQDLSQSTSAPHITVYEMSLKVNEFWLNVSNLNSKLDVPITKIT